jgi:cytosine/adenosine deaminase-related metal-dependent hydrolase
MATKTAIIASHIIAYDGEGHRHLQDGVVVYEGNTIVYVGKAYAGEVDHTIDATGKVVTPGFINTHAHVGGGAGSGGGGRPAGGDTPPATGWGGDVVASGAARLGGPRG